MFLPCLLSKLLQILYILLLNKLFQNLLSIDILVSYVLWELFSKIALILFMSLLHIYLI